MTPFPDTRESLLLQVKDPENRVAWEQFACLYRPIIYRLARRKGLQHSDAEDLVQQVLMSIAAAIPRWKRNGENVRFRHWLKRVARNAVINRLTRGPKDRGFGGTSATDLLNDIPAHAAHEDDELQVEYRRQLYLRAAETVKRDVQPDTWAAFELTVVQQQTIAHAAQQLGKSEGTIYAARSRIMRRLKDAVAEMEADE